MTGVIIKDNFLRIYLALQFGPAIIQASMFL